MAVPPLSNVPAAGRSTLFSSTATCPVMDGWATLAELQRNHPKLAVVMMTGANDNRIVDRARTAGAKELLFKPFYPKDIDAVLSRLFGLMPAKVT